MSSIAFRKLEDLENHPGVGDEKRHNHCPVVAGELKHGPSHPDA